MSEVQEHGTNIHLASGEGLMLLQKKDKSKESRRKASTWERQEGIKEDQCFITIYSHGNYINHSMRVIPWNTCCLLQAPLSGYHHGFIGGQASVWVLVGTNHIQITQSMHNYYPFKIWNISNSRTHLALWVFESIVLTSSCYIRMKCANSLWRASYALPWVILCCVEQQLSGSALPWETPFYKASVC